MGTKRNLVYLFALSFPSFTHAINKTLGDVYPALASLPSKPPTNLSPYLGGRSQPWCCDLAVNQSLQIKNGNLAFVPGQTFIRGDIETLENFGYPCTRTYTPGKPLDQPQVLVNYDWCVSNCPGWGLTQSTDLGEWARPLISFIAPSAVFSVNIPRRRRIQVPLWLLSWKIGSITSGLALLIKVPLASFIVTFDAVFWLLVVFTVSGPMVVSGLYEAMLDVRILRYLDRRIKVNSMSVRERAHLLLVVLLGNLDMDLAWHDSERLVEPLQNQSLRRKSTGFTTNGRSPVSPTTTRGLQRLDSGATEIRSLHDSHRTPTTAQLPSADVINSVKSNIKGMLESQTGFGSAVGAAIIFYSAAFIYSIIEAKSLYGSSRPAHTIAFGTFWMIVPHVAIISSFLLAGNNPHIWATAIGHLRSEQPEPSGFQGSSSDRATSPSQQTTSYGHRKSLKLKSMVLGVWKPSYQRTTYRSSWLWNRGPCKAMWIAKYAETYRRLAVTLNSEVQDLGFEGWVVSTSGMAVFLVVLPCFFSATISYTTPAMGLSCRSLTFLIYACAQVLLIFLWIVDWVFWRRDKSGVIPAAPKIMPAWANLVWYLFFLVGVLCSAFIGIFGTVFWLMGIYRNCLCLVPLYYWRYRHGRDAERTITAMGGADTKSVEMAQRFWLPIGVSATVFMLLITYIGWYYQRRLRGHFQTLAAKIDGINEDDVRENADYDAMF